MPAISRDKDKIITGHGCQPLAAAIASQFSVFVNAIPALRRGDKVVSHRVPRASKCGSHRSTIFSGSPTVFVQGVPVARRGDSADMGFCFQASQNVFANGG